MNTALNIIMHSVSCLSIFLQWPFAHTPVMSSAWLQFFLHFNSYFFAVLFVSQIVFLCDVFDDIIYVKDTSKFSDDPWFITGIIATTCGVFFEPLRLYLGYAGNLKELVPHSLIFCCLTVIPSLVIFVLGYTPLFAFTSTYQKVIYVIESVFLVCELIFGCFNAKYLIKRSTLRFYLEKDRPGPFLIEDEATYKPDAVHITMLAQPTYVPPPAPVIYEPPAPVIIEAPMPEIPMPMRAPTPPMEQPAPELPKPAKGWGYLYSGTGGLNQRRRSILEDDIQQPASSGQYHEQPLPPPGGY